METLDIRHRHEIIADLVKSNKLLDELLSALEAIQPFIPTTSASEGGAAKYSANVIAADKVRAAIASAKSADMDAWRTMDSAPKDGTVILVFAGRVGRAKYIDRFLSGWPSRDWFSLDLDGWDNDPTHWQPLPLPPKSCLCSPIQERE